MAGRSYIGWTSERRCACKPKVWLDGENEYRLSVYATLPFGASSDRWEEWREDKQDLGYLLPRRGYGILAQGFNPGNRPPGRRALKGRQVIVISNRLEKHISIGPAIVQLCAGAHY